MRAVGKQNIMVRPAALNPFVAHPVRRSMWHLTALFLMTLCVPAAGAPEPVEFGQDGLRLKGYLYRPAGNGPFPAIVALHNCEGLGEGGSPVATRYGDWGERLAAGGFVVLFPDSFGARGI